MPGHRAGGQHLETGDEPLAYVGENYKGLNAGVAGLRVADWRYISDIDLIT